MSTTHPTGARVHESAIVHPAAILGEETSVWHFCHVREGARIGARCTLGQNVYVAGDVVVGDGVKIQNNVSLYDGVRLEDDVFVGPSVVFTNVLNPRSHVPRRDHYQLTHVRQGASLGANATIVCGVNIGEFGFVGAGTVVTSDVPPFALVVGNPARQMGWMCQCGERLEDASRMTCEACGAEYELQGRRLLWTNRDEMGR